MPRLAKDVRAAIKCGPMPKLRAWRKLAPTKLTRAERNMAFAERYLKVPEGEHVGKPIRLLPFQEAFFYSVFDNPAGTRRAILSIARKNSKTVTSAMILMSFICGPEAVTNSMCCSGAMGRSQAALVFDHMCKFIRQSPELTAATKIIPSKKCIIGLARNTEFQALAKDGGRTMGRSDIVILGDEWGQIKGPSDDFVDALTSSQGAYGDRSLQIIISTQAANDMDMLSQWIDDAIRSQDPKIVCHLYCGDPECDLMDKAQWYKANPALGKFRSLPDLKEQLSQAQRLPAMEASTRNLLLNQRTSQESIWIAPGVWKENAAPPNLDAFKSNRVAMGLDLSARGDLTAAVLAARDDDGYVHLLPYVFCPTNGIEDRARRDRTPYDVWVKQGQMVPLGGNTMDYDQIARYLDQELTRLGIDYIDSIEFDRWRIDIFKRAVEEAGWVAGMEAEWHPVGQGFRDFGIRCSAFENLLLERKLRHGNHPLLTMAAANAIAVRDPTGAVKLDKSKATLRIDPIIAAVMAAFDVSESPDAIEPDMTVYVV